MLNKLGAKIAFGTMVVVTASAMIFIGFQLKDAGSVEVVKDEKVTIREDAIRIEKEDINTNLESSDKAKVIQGIEGQKEPINITFTGMTDRESMKAILLLLEEYDKKANFFLQGIKAAENGSLVSEIKDAGHIIGSYGLLGLEKIDEMSSEKLIEEFANTNIIFDEIIGEEPTLLMSNINDYNDQILKTATASGYESVIQGTKFINYKSFNSYEEVLNYMRTLESGTMLTFKLDEAIEEIELEVTEVEDNSDNDKADLDNHDLIEETEQEEVDIPESEKLLQSVQWVIRAVEQINYELPWKEYIPQYEKARIDNEGKLAEAVDEIYTTTKGLAFTFSKIGNEKALDEILTSLNKIGAKATFFVSGTEVLGYREQIAKIKSEGHEIANSGFSGANLSGKNFLEVCEEIHKGQVILEEQGISSKLFMPPYGKSSKELEEAVSAMGYKMVTYTSSPVRTQYQDMSGKEIVEDYYKSYITLRRGDIVNIRLDYYKDSKKAGSIIEEIYESKVKNTGYYKQGDINNDSEYKLMTISQLLEKTYTYPVPATILGEPEIYLGQLDSKNKFEEIKKAYIGTPHMQSTESLEGFNYDEINQLNNTGRIDTKGENTIFITFDDWGSDAAINKLLYVLDKHDVPGTFFIRSNFVAHNPNLLRAIAEEGHEVASHTLNHYLVDINRSQVGILQEDILQSYVELENVIGDLDELKLFFRPPTLAVSKLGIETVLDAGFSHVVSGDFSTRDYEAKSVEALKGKLDNGILVNGEVEKLKPGSIVVMHMSDESMFTAETLDAFFTENAKKADDDPTKYKFGKLSDYLK